MDSLKPIATVNIVRRLSNYMLLGHENLIIIIDLSLCHHVVVKLTKLSYNQRSRVLDIHLTVILLLTHISSFGKDFQMQFSDARYSRILLDTRYS